MSVKIILKNHPQLKQVNTFSADNQFLQYGNLMDGIENKNAVGRGENGMETFCESLREHTMKISNF